MILLNYLKEAIRQGSIHAVESIVHNQLLKGQELFDIIYKGYLNTKNPGEEFLMEFNKYDIDIVDKMKVLMNNFLESYKNLDKKYEDLEVKYNHLKYKYRILKYHFKFSPGGPGYLEAEKDFLNLKNQLS